ncbi:MAG: peptidoglycan-binding domain-containing protein [Pseudomonadota bacterium]
MLSKLGAVAGVLALAGLPALTPTQTKAGDEVLGAIVGGIIGGAIANSAKTQPRKTTRTSTRTVYNSAQRAENRNMQTALNYFGFPAGVADGAVGPRTRSAVAAYQTYMGFPATGQITQFERNILSGALAAGQSGMPDTVQLVARSPEGARALLKRQRDLMTGTTTTMARAYPGVPLEVSRAVDEIAASSDPSAEQLLARSGFLQLADLNGDGNNDYILDTKFAGSSFWCSSVQCKSIVFVSTPDGFARNDLLAFNPTPASFQCFGASCQVTNPGGATQLAATPAPAAPAPVAPEQGGTTLVAGAAAAKAPAIPSFGAAPAMDADPSLASHCSKVGLLSSARGGLVEVGGGASSLALSEQFCLARGFAIDTGEKAISGLAGVTPQQVEAQCAAFEPLLAPLVASLGTQDRLTVLGEVSNFVVGSGMSPDQIKVTAEACMSVGYRRDTMDLAAGGALLLVAVGQSAYSELLGHHLNEGYGVETDQGRAAEWYRDAIDALKGGAQPVFAPEVGGREALLEWAAFGGAASPVSPQPAAAAVPTFGASD